MALRFKYTRKEDVPADQVGLYAERDGQWVLDVEGAVDKNRLDEFRNNNVALQNQLKGFEGIDAEKARALLKKEQELEEGQLLKRGDVGALIETKLGPLRTDLEKERQRNRELQAQIERGKIVETIQMAGTKAGVRPTALPDLQARAASVFKVVDGQVVPADGAITLDRWLDGLKADAPHLFQENSGGGALGSGSGGAGVNHGLRNPWKAETRNLTEQGRIMRENPRLAAALMKAANVR